MYLCFRQSPPLSVKTAINESDLCSSPADYPNGKWKLLNPLKLLKKNNYIGKRYQGTDDDGLIFSHISNPFENG